MILVQQRPNAPVREATRQETCQHWMVKRSASVGRKRLFTCPFCGKAEWR